jgi:hypothetical protein
MVKDMTLQHIGSTLSFPGKHVVAVFGSLQETEQAVQALMDAGYHGEDMALIPGQDFPSVLHEHQRKEGRFREILHHLQMTTDEGFFGELLEASAHQGSAFLFLYVPHRERLDEVRALLFNHAALLVKYIGTWSVEDLFPPRKEESVSAEAPTDVDAWPESDNQQPAQTRQPSVSTQAQDWESEQALSSTAAEVADLFAMAARSAHGDGEKQGQLSVFLERSRTELSEFIFGSSQHPQQTSTAQDRGQQGVEAPLIGHDSGGAWAPLIDTADDDMDVDSEEE